ncbi:MAG: NADH-quinone oxidoreductase subunit K [Candidatus Omnitrophica bacterium]|nr:NADH-quinone oxidoreductase subunit K [Candidatus Omnitrophota bacterium]
MSGESWHVFLMFGFFIVLTFVCGLYCILVTRNLIRTIIGLELLIKAVTLLVIVAGYITGRTAVTQAMVITIIVIEVVVAAIASGIALRVFRSNDSLDVRELKRLKG